MRKSPRSTSIVAKESHGAVNGSTRAVRFARRSLSVSSGGRQMRYQCRGATQNALSITTVWRRASNCRRRQRMRTDGATRLVRTAQCSLMTVAPSRILLPPLDLPRLNGVPECGKSHMRGSVALGEAISWATSARDGGRYGQLGWGSAHVEAYTPHRIQSVAHKTVKAAAGDDHSAFVDAEGGLWLCGVDRWEQLGRGAVLWKGGAVRQREPEARASTCKTSR